MEMKIGDINLHNVVLERTCGLPSQLIKTSLPQFAFSGRSNVGKSSLINSMLGRKSLARTSSVPGKTITINYYNVDKRLYLVDLPGYGYAKRSKAEIEKWSALTQGYFDGELSSVNVIQLIDIRTGITKDDQAMLEWMKYYNVPYTVVATKCDKPNKTELNAAVQKLVGTEYIGETHQCVLFSSTKNLGRTELWKIIIDEYNKIIK